MAAKMEPSQPLCGSFDSKTNCPHWLNIFRSISRMEEPKTLNTSFFPSPFGVNALGIKKSPVLVCTVTVTLTVSRHPLADWAITEKVCDVSIIVKVWLGAV